MEAKAERKSLPLTVRVDLADLLEQRADRDRRTKSACLELILEEYLDEGTEPVVMGKLTRDKSAYGYKVRRYMIRPEVLDKLVKAEQQGYSRAFLVEEALKKELL